MRTLHACAFVALSALAAACGGGGDDKPDAAIIIPDAAPDAFIPDAPPDAQAVDLSCMSNPAPTTAMNPIAVSGTVSDIDVQAMALVPVEAADVEGIKNGVANPLDTDTSDAQGAWALSLASGATPIDGFVEATKATHRPVRLYPPEPLTNGLANAPLLLLKESTFMLLVQFVLQGTQSPTNGTVIIAVLDCAGNPMSGATVSVKQGNTELANSSNTFDTSGLGQAGAFIILDIPPGSTEVNATVNGTAFRAHTLDVVAGTNSTTAVTPGFAN